MSWKIVSESYRNCANFVEIDIVSMAIGLLNTAWLPCMKQIFDDPFVGIRL